MTLPDQIAHISYDAFDFIGFPLNSESMLILRKDQMEDSISDYKSIIFLNVEKRVVDTMNRAAITNCKEYIYSNREDTLKGLNEKYSSFFRKE